MKRKFLILFVLLISCGLFTRAADVLVEAESFADKGGWVVDQQFIKSMGSPYLMAHGLGIPVKDASTKVDFPEEGTYYVYVRTYNWTSPWTSDRGPGQFRLSVNGKKLNSVLGNRGSDWLWQSAGKINIKEREATLALHDMTGFNGRCDAIYFTTEENKLPPSDVKTLTEFRHKLLNTGIPEKIGNYDLVVVGGGVAGLSAAVSAARLGCKVALVHDRPILGGNNSSEVRVHLGGRIDAGIYKKLGGLQKEFGHSKEGNAKPAENYEDHKKMNIVTNEKNITLFNNYHAYDVKMDGQKIKSIFAKNIENGKEIELEAPLFADCTGDGTIGVLAGADYRMGREARHEYGEETAPEVADEMTMGASVQWYSKEDEKSSTFPKFQYGVIFNETNSEKVTMGEWTWETGMFLNQINDFERIRDYGMLVIFSNWSYLKNEYSKKNEYKNKSLDWVAYVSGKRESRRLLGDYILKEDDMRKNVFHEDGTAAATWTIDLHYPDPENTKNFPGTEFKSICVHIPIYPYPVPYRCLYSRNVDNLFMAGRHISVTHVALGTTRLMRTTGMFGEVVGMAASVCKKHQVEPRAVYRYYFDDLKALMEKGVGKDGFPNNQKFNEGGTLKEPPTFK